jgi:phospholipase A1
MAQDQEPIPAEQAIQGLTEDDCALVRQGVKRLACYDRLRNPAQARKAAEEKQIEAVEAQTSALQPPDTGDSRDETDAESAQQTEQENQDDGLMTNLVNRYVAAEQAIFSFSGSFLTHRPTYILPATWVKDPNGTPTSPSQDPTSYDYTVDREEAKYQISFKVPLLTGLLDDRTTLWFGYTQRSFWQVYNTDDSAPFRETNYEPELFLRYQANLDIGGGTLNGVTFGLNHESNGQSDPRSRSWNRLVGSAAYSYGHWLFMVQPWWRIPESSREDDNPDIERYLGHANYYLIRKFGEDRTLSLRLMNNLRSDNNKTSVEIGYSFPMGDTVKGFFQYYNGYGESLIDYNERIQRFGLGIMINDWL